LVEDHDCGLGSDPVFPHCPDRTMARGWESKSVEQQQEEASAQKVHRQPLTPEQITRENRRKGLELSRHRMMQQMEATSNPKYREMLERALADLDNELNRLGSE